MDVNKICEILENGGLVISPTDTVYGIMGDAMNDTIIKKIYEAKKRDISKPLILLMDSYEMIKEYTLEISYLEEKIIKKFSPGLVTLILKKNDRISDLITGGRDTVGIRIPASEELLTIIRKLGRPIISTSANISDEMVITDVSKIDERLLKYIDYVEDGGEIIAESSTIVKVDDNKINVLREGKLAEEIKKFK